MGVIEGVKHAMRIGKKIVGFVKDAIRMGQKVKNMGQTSGGRMGNKAQTSSPKAKSLSSEDFKPKEQPTPPPPPPKPQPQQQPQPRGLTEAGKVRQVAQGIKAVKREAKLIKTLQEGKDPKEKIKTIQRQKERISLEAKAPSKREFEKTAKQQQQQQQATLIGSMSPQERREFLRKAKDEAQSRATKIKKTNGVKRTKRRFL